MALQDFLRENIITDEMYNGFQPIERQRLVESYLLGEGLMDTNPSAGTDLGIGGKLGGVYDSIGGMEGLVSLGGLAMQGLALPGQLDMYDKQSDLLGQKIKHNKQAAADRNKFNKTWANASNRVSGLAGV